VGGRTPWDHGALHRSVQVKVTSPSGRVTRIQRSCSFPVGNGPARPPAAGRTRPPGHPRPLVSGRPKTVTTPCTLRTTSTIAYRIHTLVLYLSSTGGHASSAFLIAKRRAGRAPRISPPPRTRVVAHAALRHRAPRCARGTTHPAAAALARRLQRRSRGCMLAPAHALALLLEPPSCHLHTTHAAVAGAAAGCLLPRMPGYPALRVRPDAHLLSARHRPAPPRLRPYADPASLLRLLSDSPVSRSHPVPSDQSCAGLIPADRRPPTPAAVSLLLPSASPADSARRPWRRPNSPERGILSRALSSTTGSTRSRRGPPRTRPPGSARDDGPAGPFRFRK
jgi:hypothetical protein